MAGNYLFKFGHNVTYPDPCYEAPPGAPMGQSITFTTQGTVILMDDDCTPCIIIQTVLVGKI
jgi:hypothetical protein